MTENLKAENKIVLSIETAIQGGSISLLSGAEELEFFKGLRTISKAEDILETIETLLTRRRLEKSEVKKIVFSRGPGSYTGMRIGIATVLGLKTSIGCGLIGVSVLESLINFEDAAKRKSGVIIICGIPFGKNQICWQKFKIDDEGLSRSVSEPQRATIVDFFYQCLKSEPVGAIYLHRKSYLDLVAVVGANDVEGLIDVGENITALMAKTAGLKLYSEELNPIYLPEA